MRDWLVKESVWPFTVSDPAHGVAPTNARCAHHPDRPAVSGQQFQGLCQRCADAVAAVGGDVSKVNWAAQLFADPPTRTSSWQDDKDKYWEDEHDPYDHDLADAQFEKQFNEGMMRGEKLQHINELEPWTRGAQGKGLIMNDGTVHTWNDPLIHHQQVAQLVGPRNVNAFIDQIHEDGTAAMGTYDPIFKDTLKPHGIRPYDMYGQSGDMFAFG